jgi:hypothetical protein
MDALIFIIQTIQCMLIFGAALAGTCVAIALAGFCIDMWSH